MTIEHHFLVVNFSHRIETFIQQLLTDQDDTGIAQFQSLPLEGLGHLLLAIFDDGDSIAFNADTKPMPPVQTANKPHIEYHPIGIDRIHQSLTFRRSSSGRQNQLESADFGCLRRRLPGR